MLAKRWVQFRKAVAKVATKNVCTQAFDEALSDAFIAQGRLGVHIEFLTPTGGLEPSPTGYNKTTDTLRTLRKRHMKCVIKG
jgi:hypothetical protein